MNTSGNNRSHSQNSSSPKGFGRMEASQHRAASSRGGQTTASRNDMSELGRRGGTARGDRKSVV